MAREVITVSMACGCRLTWTGADDPPVCVTHNERRVRSVVAPPPRFVIKES